MWLCYRDHYIQSQRHWLARNAFHAISVHYLSSRFQSQWKLMAAATEAVHSNKNKLHDQLSLSLTHSCTMFAAFEHSNAYVDRHSLVHRGTHYGCMLDSMGAPIVRTSIRRRSLAHIHIRSMRTDLPYWWWTLMWWRSEHCGRPLVLFI